MTPSHRQEGCTGFPIEILEEVPEGEDIIDHEDLWIKYVDPELNSLPGNTDKSAISSMYRLEIMSKLLSGGTCAPQKNVPQTSNQVARLSDHLDKKMKSALQCISGETKGIYK